MSAGAPVNAGMTRLLAVAVVALVAGAVMCGNASAALTHATVEASFSAGAECSAGAGQVAFDETNELVYVACSRPYPNGPVLKRFHVNGTAAPFSATGKYIVGNAIVGNPNSPENEWQGSFRGMAIAVDNSSVHPGNVYVAAGCPACGVGELDEEKVEAFAPSGEWIHEFPVKPNEGRAIDVDVGPDGSIYVADEGRINAPSGKIRKYAASTLTEVERLFPARISSFVRVNSAGDAWTGEATETEFGGGPTYVVRFPASQFGTNLSSTSFEAASYQEASPSTLVSESGRLPNVQDVPAIDVDTTTDEVYVDSGLEITPYTSGTVEEPSHQSGPAFGSGLLSQSKGVDVSRDGRVFASSDSNVVVFGPGETVPDLSTPKPAVDAIGHTSATVTATIDRGGGGPITECAMEYGPSTTYGFEVPCSPDPGSSPPASNFTAETTEVSATPDTELVTGQTYHYRFKAANANGVNVGGDRTFVPAFVVKLHTGAATEVDTTSATLNGMFDPDGLETAYYFEFGGDTSYGQSTATTLVPASLGTTTVTAAVSELPKGHLFHYRLVASNENGVTRGEDRTFRTASPPDISGVRATEVAVESATLNARIDPLGTATTYWFEYGTTPSYGTTVPVPAEAVGSGEGPVDVSQEIAGLEPGVTYHYRVLAENVWGTTASDDTTFDFSPPACPNEHARQQSGSNYLPDCRAYELVSPPNAGSVFFFPSSILPIQGFTGLEGFHEWPVNRGTATGPSRFSYYGSLGSPPELNAPNSLADMYISTRTNTGWETTSPGLQGNEVLFAAEKECSDDLSLCIDHLAPDGAYGEFEGESAPYLFNAAGKPLGQLPTNVEVIPGGKRFEGDQRPSYDLSHFVFSSSTAVFAPGGLSATSEVPGSAYDNDIHAKSVSLISELPGGGPIPRGEAPFINFPAISTDGSHILMGTGSSAASVLFLRADDSVTYEVSRGAAVRFIGMTRSGTKVYFTTTQQLSPADTDTSSDLYMWNESGDTVTVISQGNGQGNSDSCSASWVAQCGVAGLETEMEHPFGKLSVPGPDDHLARQSGDVYFYSPELLDGANPGTAGQRNLYLFHEGAIHLVATLDPGTEIDRMQISPDGSHAAFLTASRLTGYDNRGFEEMYTYDRITGIIRCASCLPDGSPPSSDVEASQGGPFMADDGRAFFATRDSLVPQDKDGTITDVYEFVAGRPQLISSGTAARDTTAGGAFFPVVRLGLESVSSDGRDVYFSTYDSLTSNDQNGAFVKFYDARAGGGFDFRYTLAPCEAADECHGADSSEPPAPPIATSGMLDGSGNTVKHGDQAKRRNARRKRQAKKRSRNRRRHGAHRSGGQPRRERGNRE